ncbi:MAG TPA: Ig-like domain-containing protein [Kofleriaceae bacterium]|nr:Ig-like domain-containing protein [Kofleriaceae bacterium]
MLLLLAPAFAAGTLIRIPPPPKLAQAPSSNIIYLKRCIGGCPVHYGMIDDSRTQTSSIASGDVTIGPFTQSDQVWADLVQCVKNTYAPYNVVVTDVDPGSVPHFENIVGGAPGDLRGDIPNAGGVAPFTCDEIPNAISYTFDVYGPDPLTLCWTASQETAHAFGLEHELLQQDPMTYLGAELPKRFRDVDAGCGEYTPRACKCPRQTQNSYRMIVGLFGPGAPSPPTVMFTSPTDGKNVQPGFAIDVAATDDVRVDHVELYIDGTLAGSTTTEPFTFTTPDLALGPHMLEARAIDVQGTPASATIAVTAVPPCTQTKGCEGTDVCVQGVCVPGPKQPGGLGAICQIDEECLSMTCGDGGEPLKHCVEACDLATKGTCPLGFDCVPAGSGGVCWPAPSGGCCDSGGSAPRGALTLAGALLVLVLRRRR